MVEVEQRRLRALEQHRVALRHLALQHQRDVGDARALPLAERREVRDHALPVDVGRAARAAQHVLVVPARLGQLVHERRGTPQVAERHAATAGLVLVGGADAAQRRADLVRAALLFRERLEAAVVRQDQVRPLREQQVVADLDAELPRARPSPSRAPPGRPRRRCRSRTGSPCAGSRKGSGAARTCGRPRSPCGRRCARRCSARPPGRAAPAGRPACPCLRRPTGRPRSRCSAWLGTRHSTHGWHSPTRRSAGC